MRKRPGVHADADLRDRLPVLDGGPDTGPHPQYAATRPAHVDPRLRSTAHRERAARPRGDPRSRWCPTGLAGLGRPGGRRGRHRDALRPAQAAQPPSRPARRDLDGQRGTQQLRARRVRRAARSSAPDRGRRRGAAPAARPRVPGAGVRFPAMPNPPAGWVIRITVERIVGVGPWTSGEEAGAS